MRWVLCCALLGLEALAAPQSPFDVFAFFRPTVNLTAKQRERLASGTPVVSVLDATDHDIAVFSAIELPGSVSPERFLTWVDNIEEFRRSSYVVKARRFSSPPRPEDVEQLTLDDSDLESIRDCRPGHCGVKLSADEIRTLRDVAASSGPAWKQAVQTAFRAMVLHRVRTYAAHGHPGLGPYWDRKRPRSPASAFSGLLERTPFLRSRAPHVLERITNGHEETTASDSFLYWSKERMGSKSVISATHVTLLRGNGDGSPDVLMIGKQIFATHYLDACLGVTALVRESQISRPYLVYVNRSDVDLLGGFWGGIARHMIEERIEADGPALLREVAQKLASGNPPSPIRAAGQR